MVPDEGESLLGYVALAPDSGSVPAPDDGPPRMLPYAFVAISDKEMVTGVEIVLPPQRRRIKILAPTLWALIVCVLIRVCMMVYNPITAILGSDAVFATASAVVGLRTERIGFGIPEPLWT